MADPRPNIARIADSQAIDILKRTMRNIGVTANIDLSPDGFTVERRFSNGIGGKAGNLAFLKTTGFTIIHRHVPQA